MKIRGSWIVLGLGLANLVSYASRNALAPVHEALVTRYGLSNQFLGILDAGFMFSHALATPVMGWLGDRVHRTHLLMAAVFVASMALWLGAISPNPWVMLATRVIGGVATAAVVPVANSILGGLAMARGDADGSGKARMLSLFSLGLLFGGVVAFGLGPTLAYPQHLYVIGGMGLAVVLMLTALDVPARRDDTPAQVAVGSHKLTAVVHSLVRVGKSPALRRLMVSATLMAFAAGSFNKWLFQYLIHERGMSKAAATQLFAMCIAAGVLGILAGGVVADRWRRQRIAGRLHTMAVGMALTVPCSLLALQGPPALFVGACLLNMFFISWYHGPMAATIDDLAPPGMAATAQSLVIFSMHALGTSLGIYFVGLMADFFPLSTALTLPIIAVVLAAVTMAATTKRFTAHMEGATT